MRANSVQLFDVLKAAPLARLGYHQYTAVREVFDMKMPFMHDDNVNASVLGGGTTGASDAELYASKDYRPIEEKLREEREHREVKRL